MSNNKSTTIRDYLFDLGKIVDGALASDNEKVIAYCEHLRDKLIKDQEPQAARRIDQILRKRKGKSLSLAQTSANGGAIPVDSESRIPTADVEMFEPEDIKLILSPINESLVREFVDFFRAADRLVANGVGITASMIAYGPPGCGKTHLAKYLSSTLQLPLITARADALISSYLGSTSKNIRMLFEHAASRPCILFLDEFDAIGKMRDDSHELGELKRVVISLLQNIDALGSDHVLLAATNHEHLLDPAIWRRFTYKLKLDLPNHDARIKMIEHFLGNFYGPDIAQILASITEGFSGSDIQQLIENAIRRSIVNGVDEIDFLALIKPVLAKHLGEDDSITTGSADKIRALNSLTRGRLNQTTLGTIFGISQARVSQILKERGKDV